MPVTSVETSMENRRLQDREHDSLASRLWVVPSQVEKCLHIVLLAQKAAIPLSQRMRQNHGNTSFAKIQRRMTSSIRSSWQGSWTEEVGAELASLSVSGCCQFVGFPDENGVHLGEEASSGARDGVSTM
jgi:hypothetical protein